MLESLVLSSRQSLSRLVRAACRCKRMREKCCQKSFKMYLHSYCPMQVEPKFVIYESSVETRLAERRSNDTPYMYKILVVVDSGQW
jgi:hypothetical protein